MYPILAIVIILIWLYVLRVCKKSELWAWRYIIGSGGAFILMMIFVRPYLTLPLARIVASVAGAVGNLTGLFSSYFKYGVIFIDSSAGSISLMIDFECSGILEILAFISLLIFFRAYDVFERIIVGVLGVCYIILANAIRIVSICVIIYIFGIDSFYIAHTFVGRLIFYGLSILLYFLVFTKSQIIRQKVGGFTYGDNK
ncbi:MAG: exosortase family protein XrtG [Lachnospira sp.]